MPDPEGGYLKGRENNIFSFLGLAPLDDPELMMFVSVTQPTLKDNAVGSEPVSFIFKHVMENSLHYLNIEPNKEETLKLVKVTMPELTLSPKKIKEQLETEGIKVSLVGSGDKIIETNVTPGSEVLSGQHVIIITDQPEMPN